MHHTNLCQCRDVSKVQIYTTIRKLVKFIIGILSRHTLYN